MPTVTRSTSAEAALPCTLAGALVLPFAIARMHGGPRRLVAVALLLRRAWRGADWITSAGWATLAVVVSLPWEMPWYVLQVLPFAALGRSARLRRSAVVLSAFLLVTLAPITGWLLTHAGHCNASDTKTGKRHAVEIRKHLR